MDILLKIRSFVLGYLLFLEIDLNMMNPLVVLIGIGIIMELGKFLALKISVGFFRIVVMFILKMLMIFLPVSIAVMGKGLGYDWVWLIFLCTWILIVNEGISIFCDFISIRRKEEVKKYDLILVFSEFLVGYMVTMGNEVMNKIKKKP